MAESVADQRLEGEGGGGRGRRSVESARGEFPILDELTFFNHAAVSPLPRAARQVLETLAAEMARCGPLYYGRWLEGMARTRSLAAELLNCQAGELAFIRNTTHGIMLVAGGVDWRAGDNVVIPAYEFPANVTPWRSLERRGVELRVAPERDGRFLVDDFAALVDVRTRVVSVSWVDFATGFQMPLLELGALCRERGALFLVDAIQGLGAIPLDVKALPIDYLAADGHKWLLGPEGCGVFYIADEARDRLEQNLLGWQGVARPAEYLNPAPQPAAAARRFEDGSPNTLGIHALGAALELLLEVGIDRVWNEIRARVNELVDGLRRKEYMVHSSLREAERSGILSFSHPARPAGEIVRELERAGVIVSERRDGLRAAPHFYNTPEQTARLIEALPD